MKGVIWYNTSSRMNQTDRERVCQQYPFLGVKMGRWAFVKGIATGAVVGIFTNGCVDQQVPPSTLRSKPIPTLTEEQIRIPRRREMLASFTWEQLDNKELRSKITKFLADEYIAATGATIVNADTLVAQTRLHDTTEEYLWGVRQFLPSYNNHYERGATNHGENIVHINLSRLREFQQNEHPNPPGFELAAALWHEWTHRSTKEVIDGQRNPDAAVGFGVHAVTLIFRRGALEWGDIPVRGIRAEEVWTELITVRGIHEHFGIENPPYSPEYFEAGAELIGSLTRDVPFKTLYDHHEKSDKRFLEIHIGTKLPTVNSYDNTDEARGKRLLDAIDRLDRKAIEATGVYTLFPSR